MKITRGQVKNVLLLSVGCLLLSFGVYFFKIPNGFATGGVSGISVILAKVLPLSPGVLMWILNGGLLLLGFIVLGRQTGIKTVYCSMLYSAVTYLLELWIPLTAPLTDQPLLELIYAMILTSVGSAIIFSCQGSSGGTDIVALILKKYTRFDIGKVLLCTDFVVAASSFFFFGVKIGLLSLLGLFAKAFIVDGVIESLNTCKYFVVITEKKDEIATYIMQNLHRGVTVHAAIGAYTGKEKVMIHTVCRRADAIRLRARIKQIDPGAFIIVTTSNEIIGKGFRSV